MPTAKRSSRKKKTRTAQSLRLLEQVDRLTPTRYHAVIQEELAHLNPPPTTHIDPSTIDADQLLADAWRKRRRNIQW